MRGTRRGRRPRRPVEAGPAHRAVPPGRTSSRGVGSAPPASRAEDRPRSRQRASVAAASQRLGPSIDDRIRLAVAVELVAEEIGRDDDRRPDPGQDLLQRRFVHLEDRVRRPAAVERRSRPRRSDSRTSELTIPCRMFAPDRLAIGGRPGSRSIRSMSAAVVVLPFVPMTIVVDSSWPDRDGSASGQIMFDQDPGERRPAGGRRRRRGSMRSVRRDVALGRRSEVVPRPGAAGAARERRSAGTRSCRSSSTSI